MPRKRSDTTRIGFTLTRAQSGALVNAAHDSHQTTTDALKTLLQTLVDQPAQVPAAPLPPTEPFQLTIPTTLYTQLETLRQKKSYPALADMIRSSLDSLYGPLSSAARHLGCTGDQLLQHISKGRVALLRTAGPDTFILPEIKKVVAAYETALPGHAAALSELLERLESALDAAATLDLAPRVLASPDEGKVQATLYLANPTGAYPYLFDVHSIAVGKVLVLLWEMAQRQQHTGQRASVEEYDTAISTLLASLDSQNGGPLQNLLRTMSEIPPEAWTAKQQWLHLCQLTAGELSQRTPDVLENTAVALSVEADVVVRAWHQARRGSASAPSADSFVLFLAQTAHEFYGCAQQMLSLADSPLEMTAYSDLVSLALMTGQVVVAEALATESCEVAARSWEPRAVAQAYLDRARVRLARYDTLPQHDQGLLDLVLLDVRQAEEAAASVWDQWRLGEIALVEADLALRTGDDPWECYEVAHARFGELVITEYEQDGLQGQARTYLAQARLLANTEEPEEASLFYLQAQDAARAAGDDELSAEATTQLDQSGIVVFHGSADFQNAELEDYLPCLPGTNDLAPELPWCTIHDCPILLDPWSAEYYCLVDQFQPLLGGRVTGITPEEAPSASQGADAAPPGPRYTIRLTEEREIRRARPLLPAPQWQKQLLRATLINVHYHRPLTPADDPAGMLQLGFALPVAGRHRARQEPAPESNALSLFFSLTATAAVLSPE